MFSTLSVQTVDFWNSGLCFSRITTKNRLNLFCWSLVFDGTLFRQIPRISVVYRKWQLNPSKGNTALTFQKLSTLLERIETILNFRFITSLSKDTSDLSLVTPENFLIGISLTGLLDRNETSTFQNWLTRWLRFPSIFGPVGKRTISLTKGKNEANNPGLGSQTSFNHIFPFWTILNIFQSSHWYNRQPPAIKMVNW